MQGERAPLECGSVDVGEDEYRSADFPFVIMKICRI